MTDKRRERIRIGRKQSTSSEVVFNTKENVLKHLETHDSVSFAIATNPHALCVELVNEGLLVLIPRKRDKAGDLYDIFEKVK